MAAIARALRRLAEFRFGHSDPPRRRPAVPARGTPVKVQLRVYLGRRGHWCVRKENGPIEAAFVARISAIEFARLIGRAAGSYRILFETEDGCVLKERFIPR